MQWPLKTEDRILVEPGLIQDNRSYLKAFGNGSHTFEPWSSDKDNIWARTPSPNFHTTPMERHLGFDRLNVHHPLHGGSIAAQGSNCARENNC
ncbi:hypothetical protein TNCV_3791551 [Trichonephila clavipes]|nr:hypothetical protein TNCV_3791551 [Trichonephila clavipes]